MSIATDVNAFLDVSVPANHSRVPVEPPPRTQSNHRPGVEHPLVEPGSDEWYRIVSASKISALTGRSPWDSAYAIWHRMKGLAPRPEVTAAMARGHLLEPAVAEWFAQQHPEWTVRTCGTFIAADNERHTAAPDRIIDKPDVDGVPDILEVKSTTMDYEWGTPGTNEIPDYYRDQVIWQLYVTGASRCHVAMIGPFFEFAEYVVDYDPRHAADLVRIVDKFLALLDDDQPPSVDSHGATFDTVRELHPTVDAEASIDIDEALARRYVDAINGAKAGDAELIGAKTAVLDALGDAKIAAWDGKKIADRRTARPGATPTLYAARRLPEFAKIPDDGTPSSGASSSGPGTGDGTDPARSDADLEAKARAVWIASRLRNIKDAGDPKGIEAVRKFWPADVTAKPPWTAEQIDAIDALLAQVERLNAVPFPELDPTKPTPDEVMQAEREAKTAAIDAERALDPRQRDICDDSVTATAAEAADLKATVAVMTPDHKAVLHGWMVEAKFGGRPWRFSNTSTRRVAAINAAAFALVLHGIDIGDDDETAARRLIELAIGLDLQPTWPLGAVLGSLTIDEAKSLTTIAARFAAGDDEVCAVIGARLAAHYAALDAAPTSKGTP